MLWEWITSRRTRCDAAARHFGYADELAAIQARARRCRRPWSAHLDASRATILEVAGTVTPGDGPAGTLLVMGSGALLDLPLPHLRPLFKRVILADIAHPPAARRAARRHDAELVTVDLTGTVTDLATGRRPVPRCDAFTDIPDLALAVSLNLLSQLPLRPRLQWAALRGEEVGLSLGRAIIRAHLRHLAHLPAPTLLISDTRRDRVGADGAILSSEDPLLGQTLPGRPLRQWTWTLAPPGEIARDAAIHTQVAARLLLPGQPTT